MRKSLIVFMLIFFGGFSVVDAKQLIPMGDSIGIKLKLEYIVVTQDVLFETDEWLRTGDQITKVNNKQIQTIQQLMDELRQTNELLLISSAGTKEIKLNEEQVSQLRPFLKDVAEGVGTLTYIDPQTMEYGALGHQIIDESTKKMPNYREGNVFSVEISQIKKSKPGQPGYKIAQLLENVRGSVTHNELYGVFGVWKESLDESLHQPMEIMHEKDILIGPAQILTSLKSDEIKTFSIEIQEVTDGIIQFKVDDKELIKETGGIIQGMSGSPIIQNNKFIGAVTHMYVEQPVNGAGLALLEMLEKR